MKITPIEIRQKQFEKKTFGGIDKDEVSAYLNSLSIAWERNLNETSDLKERNARSDQEVNKLREIESSLYKTLKTAEETGASMVEQSRQKSSLQLREADLKAEGLLKEARWQAKTMLEEARQQAKRVYTQLQDEVGKLEQEAREITRYRDNILADLKILSNDVGERAERYQQRAQQVNFSRHTLESPPDFLASPELEAAMNQTTIAGPAKATPNEAVDSNSNLNETSAEDQNFFDNLAN